MSENFQEPEGEIFTISEAARRYRVSVATLRGRVYSGSLEALPRQSSRAALRFSVEALRAAGFELPLDRETELEAKIAGLVSELEAERAKSKELELRAVRAEALSEGAQGVVAELVPQIEKLLTEQARVSLELRAIQASTETESRGLLSRFRGRQRAN